MKAVAALLASVTMFGSAVPIPTAVTAVAPGTPPVLRLAGDCAPPTGDGGVADSARMGQLRLEDVHAVATGRGQLIAVIDTGVAPHPRLDGRLIGGGDYLADGDGLEDCDGHGTAVAGLIAATPGPDGVAGMAPAAKLLSIRQFSRVVAATGPGGPGRNAGDTGTLAAAIVRAVQAGATVINISGAGCTPPRQAEAGGNELRSALQFAARSDVVVVAAAGNRGVGGCDGPGVVPLPAWYDTEVLSVGAVGPGNRPASFTNPGPWVDVAAPGVGLRSLTVDGGTTTAGVEGTSFAAAWVAGLAALVRERFPELTASQVVNRILATARPLVDREQEVGYGVIDPLAALTAVPAVLTPPDPPPRARLLGTEPAPPPPTTPSWPLLAVTLLCAAATAAVMRLRRTGPTTYHPTRDHSGRASPLVGGSVSATAEYVHRMHGIGKIQRGPRW